MGAAPCTVSDPGPISGDKRRDPSALQPEGGQAAWKAPELSTDRREGPVSDAQPEQSGSIAAWAPPRAGPPARLPGDEGRTDPREDISSAGR